MVDESIVYTASDSSVCCGDVPTDSPDSVGDNSLAESLRLSAIDWNESSLLPGAG